MDEVEPDLVFSAARFRQPGITRSHRCVHVPESHPTGHFAFVRERHANIPAHVLLLDAVLAHDPIVLNEIQRARGRRRIRTDKGPGAENWTIQREANRWIRSNHPVDPQLRSRSQHVEREISGRHLHAEIARRAIFQVETKHHERRGIRLRLGLDEQALFSRRPHHLPDNRLITIESGQR